MKLTATLTIAALALSACSSEKTSDSDSSSGKSSENENDTTAVDTVDTAVVETVERFELSDEVLSVYKKYMKSDHWGDLKEYVANAHEVETDQDFYNLFEEAQTLIGKLNEETMDIPMETDAYEFYNAASEVNRKLEGLFLTCVAECSENRFTLLISPFDSIAKNTTGKEDDALVKLWKMAENSTGKMDQVGFKNWFGQTWDYGGSSLIGDSTAYNFLIAYDKFVQTYGKKYNPYINNLREDALNMMHSFRSYMYSKERVSRELRETLKNVKLSVDEKDKIEQRLKELEDPETNELELNCETGNCAYG